tara:strand:- start:533 stop:670 length:138 start_codon:yes stop_codon:yes gene_type:complete
MKKFRKKKKPGKKRYTRKHLGKKRMWGGNNSKNSSRVEVIQKLNQ